MNKLNLIGEIYGRLTVIELVPAIISSGRARTAWKCLCSCGKECIVRTEGLMKGTKSCGCILNGTIGALNYKHGEAKKTKEHRTWQKMKERCYGVTSGRYEQYGGRGIIVCDRWFNSYEKFLEDMGRAPSLLHSIDRLDVDGNYEPGNCRWATNKEQANNKTNNVFIEYNGLRKTMKQWAEHLNFNYKTLHKNLKYKGLTLNQIIENGKV